MSLRGVVLTGSGVMLCAHPVDGAPDELAAALGEELADDGFHERDFDRTIWYAMLLHYAGPIGDAKGLVRWVEQRRDLRVRRGRPRHPRPDAVVRRLPGSLHGYADGAAALAQGCGSRPSSAGYLAGYPNRERCSQ